MESPRFTVSSVVLGIELEHREPSGWYFRLGKLNPPHGWCGPYSSPEKAHSKAVVTLLYFAQIGQETLDEVLDDDEPAPFVDVPDVWRRAFE